MNTVSPPVVHAGLTAKMTGWIIVFIGAILLAIGIPLGGSYLGASGHTTGAVVALQGGRPTVEYTVGGVTHQNALSEHGSQFAVGQQLALCYNPANPAGAQTCGTRIVTVAFAGVGAGLVVIGLGLAVWASWRRRRLVRVVAGGVIVDAPVTGTRFNSKVHMGASALAYIACSWDEPSTGRQLQFTSEAVWTPVDPRPVMAGAGLTSLPVYIDPADAGRDYYVDTRSVVDALKQSRRV